MIFLYEWLLDWEASKLDKLVANVKLLDISCIRITAEGTAWEL